MSLKKKEREKHKNKLATGFLERFGFYVGQPEGPTGRRSGLVTTGSQKPALVIGIIFFSAVIAFIVVIVVTVRQSPGVRRSLLLLLLLSLLLFMPAPRR